jgi:hypothetical protein
MPRASHARSTALGEEVQGEGGERKQEDGKGEGHDGVR